MRVKLGRLVWRILWEGCPKDRDGECDDPSTKGRAIRISQNLSEKDELETLIHEMLHACAWFLTEEFVTRTARDISKVLWKLGYRKHDK